MDQTRHYLDFARKAYFENCYTFTSFLGEAELSDFFRIERELPDRNYTIYGGREDAGRVMIRFGSEEEFGYTVEWPIAYVEIQPLSNRFTEELSHRDYLGALMNLGIERSEVGDILVNEDGACLICSEKMAEFIMEELCKVRHTNVQTNRLPGVPEGYEQRFAARELQVASERIDGVVAKCANVSRSAAVAMIREKKVFLNGRQCESSSAVLKEGDRISVRGFGKFVYEGMQRETRKGNRVVRISVYL